MKNQCFNFLLLVALLFAANNVQAQSDRSSKIAKKTPTETVRTAPEQRAKTTNQDNRPERVDRKRADQSQNKLERRRPAKLENAEGQEVRKTREKTEVRRQPRVLNSEGKAKPGKAKKANGHRRANHPGKGKALGRNKVKGNREF